MLLGDHLLDFINKKHLVVRVVCTAYFDFFEHSINIHAFCSSELFDPLWPKSVLSINVKHSRVFFSFNRKSIDCEHMPNLCFSCAKFSIHFCNCASFKATCHHCVKSFVTSRDFDNAFSDRKSVV